MLRLIRLEHVTVSVEEASDERFRWNDTFNADIPRSDNVSSQTQHVEILEGRKLGETVVEGIARGDQL